MLPFAWHISIGQNDLDVLPGNVVVHAIMDIEAKALSQVVHEVRPGGDAVTVKMCRLFWWKLNTCNSAAHGEIITNLLQGPGVPQNCAQPPFTLTRHVTLAVLNLAAASQIRTVHW